MTTILDLLTPAFRPCMVRMDRAPWWTCGLPYGHIGEHAKLSLSPFEVKDASVPGEA